MNPCSAGQELYCVKHSLTQNINTSYICRLAFIKGISTYYTPGRLAQSVTCLDTDAYLTADPGLRVRSRSAPYFRGD